MEGHKRHLVVIDDDRLLCDSIHRAFSDGDIQVATAHTGSQGLRLCAAAPADIVLLDQKLPDASGLEFCAPILDCNERTKIVFMTAFPSFENAVQAVKAGAFDYLSKPFEIGELQLTVAKALRTLELERFERVQQYRQRQERHRATLIGAAGGLAEVRRLVDLAAANQAPVLITGETGTGKTMVAKAIHHRSPAASNAFIGVNCAAIPENLMEAELFGYEKGAFTGALTANKGLFEMAEDGTLFLDEISEIPLHLQSKLLGVLDDGRIKPLGSPRIKPVHARIIAATNVDPVQAVKERRFREDLYYRLSVVRIHVPPLRERLRDLPDLCRFFISQIAPDQSIRLEATEIEALSRYPWPGNVRELRNILERAILLQDHARIQPSRLLSDAGGPAGLPLNPGPSASSGIVSISEVEREHIRKALIHFSHNHTHTARALGVSRSTLMRKIKGYHLE